MHSADISSQILASADNGQTASFAAIFQIFTVLICLENDIKSFILPLQIRLATVAAFLFYIHINNPIVNLTANLLTSLKQKDRACLQNFAERFKWFVHVFHRFAEENMQVL